MALYQLNLPVETKLLDDIEFSFTHPAMIHPDEIFFNNNQNSNKIPSNKYQLSIPKNARIISPFEGYILAQNYNPNFPKNNLKDPHRFNYTIITNDEITIKFTHTITDLTPGTIIRKGQDIGKLFGFLGRAHLHINLENENSQLYFNNIPEDWIDRKRQISQEVIDEIIGKRVSYQEARTFLWSNGPHQQRFKDTLDQRIKKEKEKIFSNQVRFDADF